MTGDKRFLGFVETDTENEQVLTPFLRSLVERGLDVSQGLLVIVDGGKIRAPGVDRAEGRPRETTSKAIAIRSGNNHTSKNRSGDGNDIRAAAAKASATVAARTSRLWISGFRLYLIAAPKNPANSTMSTSGSSINAAARSTVHSPARTCRTGAAKLTTIPSPSVTH